MTFHFKIDKNRHYLAKLDRANQKRIVKEASEKAVNLHHFNNFYGFLQT
jgi:hypothetical protein